VVVEPGVGDLPTTRDLAARVRLVEARLRGLPGAGVERRVAESADLDLGARHATRAALRAGTPRDRHEGQRDGRRRDGGDDHLRGSFHRFPLVVVFEVVLPNLMTTHPSPRYAARTAAFCWISAGEPVASTSPRSSTTMRSHCS